MRHEDAVDRKPEIIPPIIPPVTLIGTSTSTTIPELISKLRSTFLKSEWDEVTSILQHRESKLNQTITDLKNREDELNQNNIHLKTQSQTLAKNYTDLETKHHKIALEKLQTETELRIEIVKIRDNSEKERAKNEEELVKMKKEIAGLIDAKSKAEESARVWEKNLKQCEPRVKKLEEYVSMLCNHPVIAKVVDKVPSARNPPVIKAHSVINGNPELVEPQKQSNLSKCDENAHASPCAGSTANSPMVDTNGPPKAAGPNPSDMDCGNKMPTENQEVIEIDDSDDEKPMTEAASASKTGKEYGRSYEKDPASQLISRGKRPLGSTQNNCDTGGDGCSTQDKKRKMDSPFLNKTHENSDSSDESITTLDLEKLVSRMSKNKPFKFEADMLSAFNKDDELCLNAVCALHRQEKSQYRGFSAIDATRGYLLAKFLVDGDPQGRLRKSVKELQKYDSKGIDECRKLVRNHSKQLFQIYQKEEDTFFKEYLVKNYSQKTIS